MCVSAVFTLYVLCVYMCVCTSGILKLVLGIFLCHSLYSIILEEGFLGESGRDHKIASTVLYLASKPYVSSSLYLQYWDYRCVQTKLATWDWNSGSPHLCG